MAGLHVAYGRAEMPTNGPFPSDFTVEEEPGGGGADELVVVIEYDTELTYDNDEISGYYYCCEQEVAVCGFVHDSYRPVERRLVTRPDPTHVRVVLEPGMCPPDQAGTWPTSLAYLLSLIHI